MADDAATGRDPLDLLAEQFLQRLRGGEAVTPESFAQQHGEHGPALRELLPTLLLLEQAKRERESTASSGRRLAMPQLQRLGDFRIVREVGRGGMGVVFEAVQESLGRRVALKVLPQASLLTGNQLERFRREARTAAGLHHTHIVPVFDSGEADGFHYYAMQFIDGTSLDAVVKGQREDARHGEPGALRLRCALAARIGAEVADALEHAHAQGTLHRDIKPANLLLGQDQHVWVTDFGLAKALQQEGLTHSGDVLGTLQYMAPEQFDGVYGPRTEVYALGATLYELVALRPAFRAETRSELIDRIRAGRCERLGRMAPGVPRDLETILARAMAPDAASRYGSARELADDLRAFLADRPIAARQRSAVERFSYWCKRNRALASVGAVAVAAVVIAAVVGWTAWWITDDALERANASAAATKRASERDKANLEDTLQAFADVFDTLVGPDPLHTLIAGVDGDGEIAAVAALRAPVDDRSLALLQRMLEFYDKFAQRNQDSAGLRAQTARAWQRVGAIHARLGELDDAVAAYEQALRRYRDVADADVTRDLAGLQQELGQVHVRRGQPRAAAESFQQALQLLTNDAADTSRSKRWLEARAHYLLATVPLFRAGLPEGRPGGPRPSAADGTPRPPRGPGARPDRRPPELRGERRPPPRGQRLGDRVFERLRDEARGHVEAAQQLLSELLREQPEDAECLFLQARCLLAEGRLSPPREPRPQVADRERQQQAVALLEKLVAAHPAGDAYRFELCEVLQRDRRPRGQGTEVPATLQQAVDHARVLLTHEPAHTEYQALLARCLSTLGVARNDALGTSDPTAGRDELQQALQIQRELTADREAAEPRFLLECIRTLVRLLRAQLDAGETAAAAGTARELGERAVEAAKLGALRAGDEAGRLGDLVPLLERAGVRERIDELRKLLERPPR